MKNIQPDFMDGMAFCSCYISTTGKKCGVCPHFVPYGQIYWCDIGNGANGGKICTPFFRELLKGEIERERLIKMATAGFKLADSVGYPHR